MIWMGMLLVSFIHLSAVASASCDRFWQFAMDPRVQNNAKFWEEYALRNDRSEAELMALIKKYDVDTDAAPKGPPPAVYTGARPEVKPQTVFRHQFPERLKGRSFGADRASHSDYLTFDQSIKKMDPSGYLGRRIREFVEITSRPGDPLAGLGERPKSWLLETIADKRYPDGARSVRLNQAYRLVFRVENSGGDSLIQILDVTKTGTHGGH